MSESASARPTGDPSSRAPGTFRTYLTTLVGLTRWKLALALGLVLCTGLLEGTGILLLVPLLQLVGLDVQQSGVGWVAELIQSAFRGLGVPPTLIAVLGLYVLVVSLTSLLVRWQTTNNFTLQHELVARLRRRLFRAIANTHWLFFSRHRSSDFAHALTTELDRIGLATQQLLFLIAQTTITFIYLLLALQVSAVATGLVLASGGGLLLLLRGKTRAARSAGSALSLATRGLYALAIEHLAGMKTAKGYGAEDRMVGLFSKQADLVAQVHVKTIGSYADARCWFSIGLVLILSLVVYVSLEVMAIPLAEFLLLLFLFARIMPKLSTIQQSYQQCVHMLPAFAAVTELRTQCEAAAEPSAESSEPVHLRHGIDLEDVSFAYQEGSPFAISHLTLTIPAGRITAIVGPSGTGKSTIADLVLGLIAPTEGRVLIDGKPLRTTQVRAWRDQIGYMGQETFLFHDTVRANLLWARPDAIDEELHEALRLAAAADFVSRLPEGLDTVIGDRGVRLSGGEGQRLALARALLRKPALLILDEATSNLDVDNERRIQGALEELAGSITLLVITHRLSSVRNADVIYVLEQGRLVESGDWERLVSSGQTRFQELWAAQDLALGTRTG